MDVRDAVDGRGLKLKQSQEIFCSINETCFTQNIEFSENVTSQSVRKPTFFALIS